MDDWDAGGELVHRDAVGESGKEESSLRRYPQCLKDKPVAAFLGGRRNPLTPTKRCALCRERYYLKPEERPPLSWRNETPTDEPLRVRFTRESQNEKTGPIPVSVSSPSTCPTNCSWYGRGCYAESGWMGGRWKKTPEQGLTWFDFLVQVESLPPDQVWRHNEAGDLPGVDGYIDRDLLVDLTRANDYRKGFTYTHKWSPRNRLIIEWANDHGFTINISCDSIDEVDDRITEGAKAPLTVVVPSDYPQHSRTPRHGAHVIVCPAQVTKGLTCKKCKLCAVATRKSVVAFRAHGGGAKLVSLGSVQRKLF